VRASNRNGGEVFLLPGILLFLIIIPAMGADSLHMRFVGNWPYGYLITIPRKVDQTRQLLFCGVGGGVYILDISSPSRPHMISEIRTSGEIRDLTYDDNRKLLLLANHFRGLEIWDLSDPMSPHMISNLTDVDTSWSIDISDSYAYLATNYGLEIVDVFDPFHPTIAGRFPFPDWDQYVAVVGSLAFLATPDSGLRIINISDPHRPYEIGHFDSPGHPASLAVDGNFCYLADADEGLAILDITDPTKPVLLSQWKPDPTISSSILYVVVDHEFVYLVAIWDGLFVVDVSDPINPRGIAHLPLGDEQVTELIQYGNFLFLNDYSTGLWVIDVSDPSDPRAAYNYEMPDQVVHLAKRNDYLFAPDYLRGVIRIFDISNPSWPIAVGELPTLFGCLSGTAIDKSYLYLCGLSGDPFVLSFDLTDPINPILIDSCKLTTPGRSKIKIKGDLAYIGGNGGINIIDISDPGQLKFISSCSLPGWVYGLDVYGDYLYSANNTIVENFGLRIVDISDPFHPKEISHYITPDRAFGVAYHQGYVYVADGVSGLRVIDVSDPMEPFEVGSLTLPDAAFDITLDYPYAYIADFEGGVRVIDVSNPYQPQECAYYQNVAGATMHVAVYDRYVYISALFCGIQICENLLIGIERDENERKSGRGLRQNVVRNSIQVVLPKSAEYLTIDIFNSLGQKIRHLTHSSPTGILEISVCDLPSGLYFIKISSSKGKILLEKFIVLR